MDLNYMVEVNAHEETWLPDLLQEFTSEKPHIPRSEGIVMLAEAITRLAATGSVGVFSCVPSAEKDKGEEIQPEKLGSLLSTPHNWEYGKTTQPVYALFWKKSCQQGGAELLRSGAPGSRCHNSKLLKNAAL